MIPILTILALNMLYAKSKNSNITIDYEDLDKIFMKSVMRYSQNKFLLCRICTHY